MRKILITGGPVHANLDDVKIITNRFKGGLMADMVGEFVYRSEQNSKGFHDNKCVHITYLCSKSAQQPWWDEFMGGEDTPYCDVVHHDGIDDYMAKVIILAPQMDAVVLGAAVANLIPKKRIEGKFPSHNYKEGDTIPIDFTIAPRIIDRVKEVAPNTQLFGFKLLSGVDPEELIDAAYGIVLESRATAVFANDAKNLKIVKVVCRDRSVHDMNRTKIPDVILERLEDEYYHTVHTPGVVSDSQKVFDLVKKHKKQLVHKNGIYFGAVAIKHPTDPEDAYDDGFLTTGRGKKELESCVYVSDVDHNSRTVYTTGQTKASLNAPLFHSIFYCHPTVKVIKHFHYQAPFLPTRKWYPPGTRNDSHLEGPSFNIENHGCILSYDKEGNQVTE